MTNAREVLRKAKGLPTLPVVVTRLTALLNDKKAGAARFESVVKPDPALTTNLLRLANSPYFGLRREVTSVRQAIALLGVNRVFELAASASFNHVLPKNIPGYEIESKSFWLHCISVASMSEKLAQVAGVRPPEMTFTAGLLHDIGKLAFGSLFAQEFEDILDLMWSGDVSFVDSERETIGIDHAEIGGVLADEWSLPKEVEWAARWHHDPNGAPKEVDSMLIDLVHLADCLAHTMGFGADAGQLARKMEEGSMKRLGFKVQSLEQTVGDVMDQILEMGEAFSVD